MVGESGSDQGRYEREWGDVWVRCGKGAGGLKMDVNADKVGVVVVLIHRRYRTTLHRKLYFTSPTEYRTIFKCCYVCFFLDLSGLKVSYFVEQD